MDKDHMAKECEFLSRHDVLNHILDEMRTDAVSELLSASNTDYETIAACQAKAGAVDTIRSMFRFHMDQAGANKPGSVV